MFLRNDAASQYTRGEVVVYPTITSGAVGLSGQGMAALEAVRFSAPELKLS